MQEALPYRTWLPLVQAKIRTVRPSPAVIIKEEGDKEGQNLKSFISENAVVVIGRKGCCMCHVMNILLLGLGVNPAVYEMGEEEENDFLDESEKTQFPAMFIGGKLFGGLDRVMATHISGDLIPLLKQAGALWL